MGLTICGIIYVIGSLLGLLIMIAYHRMRYKSRGDYYKFCVSDAFYVFIVTTLSWIGVLLASITVGEEIPLWSKPKMK